MKDKRTYTGQVIATKHRRPLRFLFSESFETAQEAKKKELWWKSGAGRKKLRNILKSVFINLF